MKSKALKIWLPIVIVCIIAVGAVSVLVYFLCKDKGNNTDATSVVTQVTEKISEATSSLTTSINDLADSTASSASVGAQSLTWDSNDINAFQNINNNSTPFLYALDYVARNATIENGYSYGFNYGYVYAGEGEYSGFDGMIYFTCEKIDNEVMYYINYEVEYGGLTLNFNLTLKCLLNDNGEVEKATFNFCLAPYAWEIWAVEYDFVNNSYQGFHFYVDYTGFTSEADFSWGEETGKELVEMYNNGTLTYDAISAYDWADGYIITSNITSNYRSLLMNGFALSADGETAGNIVKAYYNGVYNSMESVTMHVDDTFINKNDTLIVNYIQDALDYGENKGRLIHGETLFSQFIEYDDLMEMFAEIDKLFDGTSTANVSFTAHYWTYTDETRNNGVTVRADDDYTIDNHINALNIFYQNAYNYIDLIGEARYAGEIGIYDSRFTTVTSGMNEDGSIYVYEVYSTGECDVKLSLAYSVSNGVATVSIAIDYCYYYSDN